MVEDSVEQQAKQAFTGETLDSWSWIARARAAARRALEPATPQLVQKAESDAESREPRED